MLTLESLQRWVRPLSPWCSMHQLFISLSTLSGWWMAISGPYKKIRSCWQNHQIRKLQFPGHCKQLWEMQSETPIVAITWLVTAIGWSICHCQSASSQASRIALSKHL